MEPINAALRAFEAEGLTADPNILSVMDVDVKAAAAPRNAPPSLVFTVMVQQINCTRNRKGEIIEGADNEIRAVYYWFAVQRVYNEAIAALEWRVDEFVVQGKVLYL